MAGLPVEPGDELPVVQGLTDPSASRPMTQRNFDDEEARRTRRTNRGSFNVTILPLVPRWGPQGWVLGVRVWSWCPAFG